MSVHIMSKEQKQSFGYYVVPSSDEQLVKYFHLDYYDKSIIRTLRNDST